jgi:hypothetical protein
MSPAANPLAQDLESTDAQETGGHHDTNQNPDRSREHVVSSSARGKSIGSATS